MKSMEQLVASLVADAEKTRDILRAAMQATDRGRRLQGARVLPIPTQALAGTAGLPGGTALLWGGAGRLMGWTLRNSGTGGSLVVNFYDGEKDGGQLVATVSIGSNSAWQNAVVWFGPSGLSVTEKLSVEVVVTGATAVLAGAAYYGATD